MVLTFSGLLFLWTAPLQLIALGFCLSSVAAGRPVGQIGTSVTLIALDLAGYTVSVAPLAQAMLRFRKLAGAVRPSIARTIVFLAIAGPWLVLGIAFLTIFALICLGLLP